MKARLLLITGLATVFLPFDMVPAMGQGNPPSHLRLVLESGTVSVQGATPGGKVVLFGVDRVVGDDDYPTTFVTREVTEDGDRDGTIEHQLDHRLPVRRVWVAVDLTSGAADVSIPGDNGQRVEGWRGRGLRQTGRHAVEDDRGALEILLVRPGSGAWGELVRDGGQEDEDGAVDGRLAAVLDQLAPVGGSSRAPQDFQRGDLVFAVDPVAMSLVADSVKGNP